MKFNQDSILAKVSEALEVLEITDGADQIRRDGQRRAAVLMPLVKRGSIWNVIFTQRPDTMPNHAGQISFPGGKVEKNERARTAALRETQEEIGIEASKISLMGRLPSFDAAYAFRVTPFVGIVDSAADIRPDPREVAEVFEVPFEFFMNSDNHKPHPVNYGDKDFTMYDMPYTDAGGTYRYIWGMTAMIIYNLYQRGFEHGA